MGNPKQESKNGMLLPHLQWGRAKVRLECAFLGKTHRFEIDGSFARIGSDPRCEFCIPGLPAPVCVYLQISRSYLTVIELIESEPPSVCEPILALPGATVWIQPNARITVESIEPSGSQVEEPESFSWENFNVDDVRVFANTLVARSGFITNQAGPPQFRLLSTISILGTASSCHLRANHKHISKYQAIIFRGEHQGESCRVVDLFGEYPTLVGNASAAGHVLEIGGKLQISNLTFEAVRFLYNASRPGQVVEVRSQFTSLPLPDQRKDQSAEHRPSSITKGIDAVKDRLVRAIGFDSGKPPKAGVHFPLDAPNENSPKDTPAKTELVEPELIAGLERVAISQERMAAEFQKLTDRLEVVEKSLISIPEILEQNSLQLTQTVESLRGVVEKSSQRAMAPDLFSREAENEILPKQASPANSKPPLNNPKVGESKPRSFAKPTPGAQKPDKKRVDSSVSKASPVGPQEQQNQTKQNSWLDRTTAALSSWIPNKARTRREIAERDDVSDPLNLGSQSTASRKRLQHHDDESELLAASQSEDESLVLGSLMGFRYRDARKSFFRWLLFAIVLIATSVVVAPLAWKKIPEGWRELIWQKITFAKPGEEAEYVPSTPQQPQEVPDLSSPTDDPQPATPSPEPPSVNSTDPALSNSPSL
jgi:hypothetical protein